MKNTIFLLSLILGLLTSCGSSKEQTYSDDVVETRGERGQRPDGKRDMAKMFAEMDVNDDGRLAKLEVKGRLTENFEEIDKDGDGYITMEEIENAPKPPRGNRGPKRN